MIEITTKAYTFDELSDDAQAKACEDNRYCNTEFSEWHDYHIEYYTEKLEDEGWKDIDISFSGFCSQGDGASFTGKVCDLPKLNIAWGLGLTKLQAFVLGEYTTITLVRHNHHYSHSNTVHCNIEYYNSKATPRIDRLLTKLEEKIDSMAKDVMGDIYNYLEKEYEWQTSDKCIGENLLANGVLFTEDGKSSIHLYS